MNSTKSMARRAGMLYFLFMVVAIYGEFFFPTFLVPDDPAATARQITGAETTYRIGILIGLVIHVIFIFLVVSLYQLFEKVDKGQALLMVLFVCIGVAVALANMLNRFAPLVFLGGGDSVSALTPPQREALALGALRFRSSGAAVVTAFWGLWLFPFGSLTIRSRFLPRFLGILLLVAGFAYLMTSVVAIVSPASRQLVSKFMMPLYFGEVPIIFWLLIKGAAEVGGQRAPEA